MKQLIVTFFIVFLILLGVFSVTGIIKANLDSYDARKMHSDIISELENSNLSQSVVTNSIERAADAGYVLEITSVVDGAGKPLMAEVNLKYEYTIPFLGVKDNFHEIHGYAR